MDVTIYEKYFKTLEEEAIQMQRVRLLELQLDLNSQGRFEEEELIIKRLKELE